MLAAQTEAAQSVNVAWDRNPESNIAGYRVMYGGTSGQYTQLQDAGSGTSTVVPDLAEGGTYYFAVTAYNDSSIESLPSGEFSFVIPIVLPVPSPTPAPDATPSPTPAPGPSPSPNPSATPTPTPAPEPSPLATPTPTPAAPPLPTPTPTATPVATPFPTPTPASIPFTLTVNSTQADVGQTIQVTLNKSFQNGLDLIALYSVGGSSPVDFFYLNGTKTPPFWSLKSATLSFVMPAAGQFEFRFYSGSQVFATSARITVAGPAPTPTPSPSSLATSFSNVSTRAYVQTGENVLIGGLIIAGDVPKKVVLRAIGPSLIAAGLSNALRDPTINLYDSRGVVIGSNDNWRSNANAVQATGLAPSSDFESAIVTTLAPGAYTAVVSGVGGSKGVALFELYDAAAANARIANIATRGKVDAGDNVMIGGFIIGGGQPSQVLVRALGPSLTSAGVAGALADPSLDLYDSNGSRIFSNYNWRSSQEQQIAASGLAPRDNNECAIIATLQPGSYTAVVRGAGNSAGVALVEVYNLSK